MTVDLAGTAFDLTKTFTYNPAFQIVSETRRNDAYAWTGHANGTASYPVNGLNQVTSLNGNPAAHDARGNLTTDPATNKSYTYLRSNGQLREVLSPWASLSQDALDRLIAVNEGGVTTRFGTDGMTTIAEYDGANAAKRRYAHGPGIDEPIVWYEGGSVVDRPFLIADERGSVIAVTDSWANPIAVNRYERIWQSAIREPRQPKVRLYRPDVAEPAWGAFITSCARPSSTLKDQAHA